MTDFLAPQHSDSSPFPTLYDYRVVLVALAAVNPDKTAPTTPAIPFVQDALVKVRLSDQPGHADFLAECTRRGWHQTDASEGAIDGSVMVAVLRCRCGRRAVLTLGANDAPPVRWQLEPLRLDADWTEPDGVWGVELGKHAPNQPQVMAIEADPADDEGVF